MSLFQRAHAPMQEPELSPEMRKRLDALEETNQRHERIVKDLRLEWDEMYDKFRLLYARVAKRIKDAAAQAEADGNGAESRQDAPGSTNARGLAVQHGGAEPTRRNY
jgi:hypothetical protein